MKNEKGSVTTNWPLTKFRQCGAICLAILLGLLTANGGGPAVVAHETTRFVVELAPGLTTQSVTGRLFVIMTNKTDPMETVAVDFLNPETSWITAVEVRNLAPGKSVEVDPDALAFPHPFSKVPAGDYQVMALLDPNHTYAYNQMDEGDLYSAVVRLPRLSPSSMSPVKLTLGRRATARPGTTGTDNIKLVTFQSPSLTQFWGRPVMMQAAVVLPPGYATSSTRTYPTVYVVHGFGGSHLDAWRSGPARIKAMTEGKTPEMIYVYLNGSFPSGHHEFADSVNNGPWGRALTTELIPHLERRFRMQALAGGRLLTGHSSGGWSTLWLQINYPDVFGATWSTSPDPVDFRDFTGPDLTKFQPENFYRKADGTPRNLVRYRGRNIMTVEQFALLEQVSGDYGGQLASFEAVFSPRGEDGRPMPLFDRETGAIDPVVQKAWERYDISRLLRANWAKLKPKLQGKIHIIVGTDDNFHLEKAAYLLRDTLKELGSDAVFEFVPGRDHFDLFRGGLSERIAREMYAYSRAQPGERGKQPRR